MILLSASSSETPNATSNWFDRLCVKQNLLTISATEATSAIWLRIRVSTRRASIVITQLYKRVILQSEFGLISTRKSYGNGARRADACRDNIDCLARSARWTG